MISIAQTAKKIGLSPSKWPHNCYYIASLIVEHKLVIGDAVYGHYVGHVAKSKYYQHIGCDFYRHGWIITPDDQIIDPTRWVFENKKPYIYQGPSTNNEYDEAGARFRQASLGRIPDVDQGVRIIPLCMSSELRHIITQHCLACRLTARRLGWFANHHPSFFGKCAQEFYRLLKENRLGGLIPIDNYRMVHRSWQTN